MVLKYFCRNGVKSVIPSNKIKAWLRKIVINKIRTLKKKEETYKNNLDLAKSEYRNNFSSNHTFMYRQKTSNLVYYNELYEKINQLNNQEWKRILMLVIQGYSGKEIASVLIEEGYEKFSTDIDKLVVRIRQNKSRALKKLRTIYLNNK